MIKWGILSTAQIAEEQMIPAILQAKNSTLFAIASRNYAKASKICNQFSIPRAFGTYEELIVCPDIEAVYIPLPTSHHVEWSIKCLEAGKHVLCEKPIALKADEINKLADTASKNNKIISEAFMVYYHPQWQKVQTLITNRSIGTLKQVQGAFTYYNKDPLLDIGVYPIVTTRIATREEPIGVRSNVVFDDTFGVDVYASVDLTFLSFQLNFYVSTQMSLNQQMVFHGDKGRVVVHAPFNARRYGDARVTLFSQDNSERLEYRFGEFNQYTAEVEAFSEAILKENPKTLFSIESSRNNQKVIDRIFEANQSGRYETFETET